MIVTVGTRVHSKNRIDPLGALPIYPDEVLEVTSVLGNSTLVVKRASGGYVTVPKSGVEIISPD